MRKSHLWPISFFAAAFMFLWSLASTVQAQLADVTQPGDPIVATSNNSPGSEGVANAIDNAPTKYLNFDRTNTGFTVTPSIGLSVVQCLTLTSANDAPERDPATYTLEGSYDGSNFTAIASGPVPAFTTRFQKVTIRFENNTPYLRYRLIFPEVVGPGGNSMQIAEVEFLGFLAPSDVTQPGDPIVASSNNSPGSEGVANAIDNAPTKYLNFDRTNTGFTVTPSVGGTLVSGITLTSANDAPERDPATYSLEGSLDGTSFFPIASGTVPAFPSRFYKNYIFFPNARAYKAYRLIFPEVVGPGGNSMQISEVELIGVVSDVPQDVTQPGDPIVASSNNSPGSEGVANAIDNAPTKYLNFDRLNTGFTVSPGAGLTLVSGLTLTSANDAPERDPATYTLEGSYNGSNFTAIASGSVPAFTNRFQKVTVLFNNKIPYLQYRLIFPEVVGPGGNSMQISEVELLGVLAPTDVTVPGDPIVASSNNSPGSEGVANAIDNQPTKYLNFDIVNTGFTVTPGVGDTIVVGLTLTSANDAADRDPASYVLTGANDGSNYVAISSGAVPPFPTRFYKNYIFFPENTKSFKSYRLIFPVTAGPSTCCMQIAEVEFLGVTPGVINTNPVDNLIRTQPQDTPVLLGSTATFRVTLTGPWKVQWYRNGVAIPGANNASYTTPAATAGDDGALFQALVQGRDGQQRSDEVMLNIFTPSVTESIGLSWQGSGANGAPTAMLMNDITGFQPQAYWNNLTGGSGTLAPPINSSNQPSATISLAWTTSGEWGAGTGNSDPLERMLNGIATSRGTTEASAQNVTFSGVPQGNHSVFVYTVQVPQEFANMDFEVVTHDTGGNDVVQRRYIRPLNSDEYNPSPGFSLVTAETAATRGVGNMMRFDNLQPGPDGIIQVRFFVPGRLGAQGPGINGMQLLLNPPPAGAPPIITRQPVSANGIVGGQIVLTVEATGPSLTYQWLKNGQAIAGATQPQYTLATLQTNDAGNYSVAISNPAGRVASRTAVVGVVASAQLTFGMRSYFKFDDEDGPVATNSATGGLNGEVIGAFPAHEAGQVGTALSFNTTDGTRVLVSDYPKVGQAMTVAGWVMSPNAQWGPIINNWVEGRTTGQSGQFMVDVVYDSTGALVMRGQIEVGPNRVLATGALNSEQSDNFVWHHFAMSANGITLSIYWDGQLLSTVDYLGSINGTSLPWLSLGANLTADTVPVPNPALTPNLWSGAQDDVALWNRSLSDIELLGIYRCGLGGTNIANCPPVLNTNINNFPVAVDDTATTTPGTAVTINVLANDSDPDGDTLTVTAITAPAHGSAVINTNSSVIYTPVTNYVGADSFNYTVADGRGGVDTATVRVIITLGGGTVPVVTCPANITTNTTSTAGVVVNYVASASDPGGIASFNCVPPSGSVFPIGQTTVTCTASNLAGNTASCSFIITVQLSSANNPPLAYSKDVFTDQGVPVSFTLDGFDPDGDPLTYMLLSQPPAGAGVLTLVASNLVTYTPSATYVGMFMFDYNVCDPQVCTFANNICVFVRQRTTNTAPTARIVASPVADFSPNLDHKVLITCNGSNACLELGGATSSDAESSAHDLSFQWFGEPSLLPLASGVVVSNMLDLGLQTVRLAVTDPQGATGTETLTVEVLSTDEALELLFDKINGANVARKSKRPFLTTLKAATTSLARGQNQTAAIQLKAFQSKVRAQLGREHPAEAETWLRWSQYVIDALNR